MVKGNGGLLKAVAVTGAVFGLVGGIFAASVFLGPGKDVARHEAQLLDTTVTLTSHGSKIAVLEATYADIKAALVRIEAKVERGTP